MKEVVQVLDTTPLITPEVLEVTRWVSDYYGSPGRGHQRRLPPGISPGISQFLKLTSSGDERLKESDDSDLPTPRFRVLRAIADAGEINLDSLSQMLPKGETVRAVKELQKTGWLRHCKDPCFRPQKPGPSEWSSS